jgi:Arc/MetJ-type ribon-helix-helix transcriptional regulator
MSRRKSRDGYNERMSVGFTTEQMRRIEELLRVRARQGKMQHKTDLIREAVNLYLAQQDDIPGTRAAITRKLEGRLDAVEAQLARQNELLDRLVAFFSQRRQGG